MFSRCVLLGAWVRLGRLHEESAGMRRQPGEASDALVVYLIVLGLVGGAAVGIAIRVCLLVSYSASTARILAGAAALILGYPQSRQPGDSGPNTVRERCDGTPDAPAAATSQTQLLTTTPNAAEQRRAEPNRAK